jgi:hypothetical protein
MTPIQQRIAAWCKCWVLFVRYRWSRGGLTVRALRQLAQRKVVPQTIEEERVLTTLSPKISLDIGQVASDARLAPGIVEGVLLRYAQDGTVKEEPDETGYSRYRLDDEVEVDVVSAR